MIVSGLIWILLVWQPYRPEGQAFRTRSEERCGFLLGKAWNEIKAARKSGHRGGYATCVPIDDTRS